MSSSSLKGANGRKRLCPKEYINARTSFGLVGAVSHEDSLLIGVALECLGHRRLHGQPPGLGEVEGLRVLLVAEVDEVGADRSEPGGIQQKNWCKMGGNSSVVWVRFPRVKTGKNGFFYKELEGTEAAHLFPEHPRDPRLGCTRPVLEVIGGSAGPGAGRTVGELQPEAVRELVELDARPEIDGDLAGCKTDATPRQAPEKKIRSLYLDVVRDGDGRNQERQAARRVFQIYRDACRRGGKGWSCVVVSWSEWR